MRNITKNFDTEIIVMALFKQFKLAARIFLAKKCPSPSSLFMEQLFSATRSSKVKFLKRARLTTTVSTFISIEFLFSRHKIHPLRLIVDFKIRYQDDGSVENAECGVWKMRSVENAGCGK